jgi:selenide,water dikinase
VIVDARTADDAAVYRLPSGEVIVQTVDFFTPVVDDPFQFGQVAAANSLSDIYAMGARPLFALNVVGFPTRDLPMEVLREILRGGAQKAAEAGIPIVGGHSIDDKEPKYGLVVTGILGPEGPLTNAAAAAGDLLVLTKPLGSGILSTGIKRQKVDAEDLQRVVNVMTHLNKGAADAARVAGVRAATDVTGYGLLGHLREMLLASGVGARILAPAVPFLPRVIDLAAEGVVPGGSQRNFETMRQFVSFAPSIGEPLRLALADAQTSGGLLLSISPERVEILIGALREKGTLVQAVIGEFVSDHPGRIEVVVEPWGAVLR